MKKRLLTGWSWTRGAFLFLGGWVMIQSALEGQWIGIFLGFLPAAMGLLGLGCAAGSCTNRTCGVEPESGHKNKESTKYS